MTLPYKRHLLKISGEALAGQEGEKTGIAHNMLDKIATDIKKIHDKGCQVGVVIGGGNIFRGVAGSAQHGIDRSTSDSMGMMATVINGLALRNAFEQKGMTTSLMSAIEMPSVCEYYNHRRALNYMAAGHVLIFVAGTGNPYFTTDSAGVLKASEMHCDILLKATKVDGLYTDDPVTNPKADFIPETTYSDVLSKQLKVMDLTAIALAKENNMPLGIFSIFEENSLEKILEGKNRFTLIK